MENPGMLIIREQEGWLIFKDLLKNLVAEGVASGPYYFCARPTLFLSEQHLLQLLARAPILLTFSVTEGVASDPHDLSKD